METIVIPYSVRANTAFRGLYINNLVTPDMVFQDRICLPEVFLLFWCHAKLIDPYIAQGIACFLEIA